MPVNIETSTAIIKMIRDHIVCIEYHHHVKEEGIETVKENTEAALRLGQGKASLLIIPSPDALLTPEARAYIEKKVLDFPFVAVVLTSLAQRLLFNFIMNIKGRVTMRTFRSRMGAILWLEMKNDRSQAN